MYDPELANGLQDADIEMAEVIASNNSLRRGKKRLCDHGWLRPTEDKKGMICNHCGVELESSHQAWEISCMFRDGLEDEVDEKFIRYI